MASHSESSPSTTIPSAAAPREAAASHCRLEPEPLRERLEWIRREVLPDATSSERLADGPGRVWTFPDRPAVRARLERLVALERDCCRGPVTFRLEEDPAAGGLRLVLRGMDPTSSCSAPLPPLVASSGKRGAPAREGERTTLAGRLRRLAKATGAGFTLAFGLACGLPWIAAALFGGAVAAPLARLDGPIPIASLTIGAALVFWGGWGYRARLRR